MKPMHSFRRDLNAKRLPRQRHRGSNQPLTDAWYLTSHFGARSDDQRRAKAAKPIGGGTYGELRREARNDFIVEAVMFALIAGLVIVAFGFCAAGLSEFLQAISVSS